MVGQRPALRQVHPGRIQLVDDELVHLGARVSRSLLELDATDDRDAAEHVQQDVIIEGPERLKLGFDGRLIRHGDILERCEQQVGPGDAPKGIVPDAVDFLEPERAARRPGLAVKLAPLPVVEPVAAARGRDYLVRADVAYVEVSPGRIAQHRIHGRQTTEHFLVSLEEVIRRDDAGR